jgi:hypothetical protein
MRLRLYSVVPKPGWIEGDWNEIISSQSCRGLNSCQIPSSVELKNKALNSTVNPRREKLKLPGRRTLWKRGEGRNQRKG